MNLREQMDQIYRNIPADKIPWNIMEPPKLLVEAVDSDEISPCKAVDLGCGAGNYAVWLAERGFDVTGLDFSRYAVEQARQLAEGRGLSCRFAVADLLGDLKEYRGQFEFAYDWELLHHIFPEDRSAYLDNVRRLLRPGAKYFSVCFNEADPAFGGNGKYRTTNLGTVLYFSSQEELEALYSFRFHILQIDAVEISGKYSAHIVNVAWLKRA
jgi:2-polyprenyl-3-methyl-5-hydroxy-6-metoxy-1,4-benzoquinol methylase